MNILPCPCTDSPTVLAPEPPSTGYSHQYPIAFMLTLLESLDNTIQRTWDTLELLVYTDATVEQIRRELVLVVKLCARLIADPLEDEAIARADWAEQDAIKAQLPARETWHRPQKPQAGTPQAAETAA